MTILLFFKFVFIYLGFLAVLTNKTMFICFFGEPLLKYDIVTFFNFIFNRPFWCFFFLLFLKNKLLYCYNVCPLCRVLFDTDY